MSSSKCLLSEAFGIWKYVSKVSPMVILYSRFCGKLKFEKSRQLRERTWTSSGKCACILRINNSQKSACVLDLL